MLSSFLNKTQQLQRAQSQSTEQFGQNGRKNTDASGQFESLLQVENEESIKVPSVESVEANKDSKSEPNPTVTPHDFEEELVLLNFQSHSAKSASRSKSVQPDQPPVELLNSVAGTTDTDSLADADEFTEQAILLPFNRDEIRKHVQPSTQDPGQKSVPVTENPDDAVSSQPESDPINEGIATTDLKNCWKPASETVAAESQIDGPDEILLPISETVIVESSSRIVSQNSTQPNPVASIEIGGITNHAKTESPTQTIATPAAVPQQVAETFLKEISVTSNQGAKTITMQLHPAELGKLTVKIGWENDHVTASIVASDKATSELLIRDRQWLVNNMANNGFDLSSFDVSYEGSGSDRGAEDMLGARSDSGRGKETQQAAEDHAEGNETDQDAAEAEMLQQYLSGTGSVVNLVA